MKKILALVLVLTMYQNGISQSNAKRALFIGNSYTYYNDMPDLVRSCGLSVGDTLVTDQNTISGATWKLHAGNAVTNAKIKQGGFDHVILQANSQEFTYTDNTVTSNTLPYGKYLDSLAHLYNPCAQTIFYNTWGRKNGNNGQTYLQQDTLIEQRYKSFANERNAMISPVGPVRRYLRTNNPTIELYVADESHPTLEGSFVSAVCFYTVIFRKDPTLITFKPSAMSAANAIAIKQAVKLIVYNDFTNWNVGVFDPFLPQADFSFATVSETNVDFTNTSLHAATYSWQFDDNTTTTAVSPMHIFPESGIYSVTLTAAFCKLKHSITKTVIVSSDKPIISNISLTPEYVYPTDAPLVSATINDNLGVKRAQLYWGTSSGTLTNMIFMNAWGNKYSAKIPAQDANTSIYYKIVAIDTDNQTSTSEVSDYVVKEVVVTLTPANRTVYRNETVQFSASAINTNGNPVTFVPTWSAEAGTITSSGLYTAPYEPGTYRISASQEGVNGKGFAYVTVSAIPVIAGKVEAENFVSMSGIQLENTEDADGGKDVAYIDANDFMTYEVQVLRSGNYQVEFRVASTIVNAKMELFSGTTALGILTIPTATGGWQNWQSFTMNVDLSAGTQVLKVVAKTAGFNLNWMKFTELNIPLGLSFYPGAEHEETMVTRIAPNPFVVKTSIELANDGEKQIQLINAQGVQMVQFVTLKNLLEIGEELRPGIYQLNVLTKDKSQTVKIIKQE